MSTQEGKKRVQVTLSNALIDRLDAYCGRTGITRSAYIAYVVGTSLDTAEALQSATAQALAAQALSSVADAEPNESGTYVF